VSQGGLDHIPEKERLLHAVAVLSQTRTFPLNGVELEHQLEWLLGIDCGSQLQRRTSLRAQLALDESCDSVWEFCEEEVERLLLESHHHLQETFEDLRCRMFQRHGTLLDAIRAFRRRHGEQRQGTIHLVDTKASPTQTLGAAGSRCATALCDVGLVPNGVRGATACLQLLSGSLRSKMPLPLTVFALRLGCIPLSELAVLRNRLVEKYTTLPRAFDMLGDSESISAGAFEKEWRALAHKTEASCGSYTQSDTLAEQSKLLFMACDDNSDGMLDISDLRHAFSTVAASTTLERLRTSILFKWGGWRPALTAAGINQRDAVTPSTLIALAAPLDVCYEDAKLIFERLDVERNGQISHSAFTHRLSIEAEGFTLHELIVRLWLASDAGGPTLLEQLARMQVPSDVALPLEAFATAFFGVRVSEQSRRKFSLSRKAYSSSLDVSAQSATQRMTSKGASLQPPPNAEVPKITPRRQSVDCKLNLTNGSAPVFLLATPPLTEMEIFVAYNALWEKYGHVTLNTFRMELTCHDFVSDIMALDRAAVSPGETVLVRYRVPGSLRSQLAEHPFIAMVPREMTWFAGGGGSWFTNGHVNSEVSGPKVPLDGQLDGAFQVQVPSMGWSFNGQHVDFRLFASPDGNKVGKQLGRSARLQLRPPPVPRPLIAADHLTSKSLRLLWEPPLQVHDGGLMGDGTAAAPNALSFIVRGRPVGLHFEERVSGEEGPRVPAWSHCQQKMTRLYCHEVDNLAPGMTYRFQVSAVFKGHPLGRIEHTPRKVESNLDVRSRSPSPRPTKGALRQPSSMSHAPRSPRSGFDTQSEGYAVSTIEGPPSAFVEVTLPLSTELQSPGRPELVDRGLGGALVLQWTPRSGTAADATSIVRNTADFQLFWDIEPAVGSYDEMSFQRAGGRFWRFPGPSWTRRRNDSIIECVAHLPLEPQAGFARFCVRAIDDVNDMEAVGEPSEPMAVLTPAEAMFQDLLGARELAEMAVPLGGFACLLKTMTEVGLGGDTGSGLVLRSHSDLMRKVSEVGDVEGFLHLLEGVDMKSFDKACAVVKSVQKRSVRNIDATALDEVLALVEEGGGARAFVEGLGGLSMRELVAAGPILTEAGLVRKRCGGVDETGVLSDPRRAGVIGALAGAFDSTAIPLEEVEWHANTLGKMVQAGGDALDWGRLVELVASHGGPATGAGLLEYAGHRSQEMLQALNAASLDARELIRFVSEAQAAALIGPAADKSQRRVLFRRLRDAGGATVLYDAIEGFDLAVLGPAMRLLHVAGLHDVSCLSPAESSQPRMSLWCQLARVVEDEGGIEVALGGAQDLAEKQRRSHTEKLKLQRLVDQSGGEHMVEQLLAKLASAGGTERFLEDLGALDAGWVGTVLRNVRKLGGSLEDLSKVVVHANLAGGISKFLGALRELDMTRFLEEVDEVKAVGKYLEKALPSRLRVKPMTYAPIISKVLSETTAEDFLRGFASVSLGSLAGLVPLLTTAGLLRVHGQKASPSESADTSESFLRWVAQAGGASRLGAALECVEPRLFTKCMDVVCSAGLGRMQAVSLGKVVHWLTTCVNPSGGLEVVIDSTAGLDLLGTTQLLVRLDAIEHAVEHLGDATAGALAPDTASAASAGQRTKGLPLPPDRFAAAQIAMGDLVDLAEAAGGTAPLRKLVREVDVRYLEPMINVLVAMDMHRPDSRLAKSPLVFAPGGKGDPKVEARFRAWLRIAELAQGLGGAEAFCAKANAVDLMHFDACLNVLRAAGLVRQEYGTMEMRMLRQAGMEKELTPSELDEWRDVAALVAAGGGPGFFLKHLDGIDTRELLGKFPLLRLAGLLPPSVQGGGSAHGTASCGRTGVARSDTARLSPRSPPGMTANDHVGEMECTDDDCRARMEMLQEFLQKAVDAGGFHTFWYALRGVDLCTLAEDLHCLRVVRNKLCEDSSDETWKVVTDATRLEDLLETLGGWKRLDGDFTSKQRERLARKLQETGGFDGFFAAFDKFNLSIAAKQLQMLQDGGVKCPQVTLELTRIGKLVKHDIDQLRGLKDVVSTLVAWLGVQGKTSTEPSTVWCNLNEQVVWLLGAITENGAMTRGLSKRGGCATDAKKATTDAKKLGRPEVELTPARLAQFLQVLQPLGGVHGFLTAFHDIDLPTAAAQTRILIDASVHSVDTVKRFANIFRLLKHDPTHLRGLEDFVRRFGAEVMLDTACDKARTVERWQALADYLAAAARGEVLVAAGASAGAAAAPLAMAQGTPKLPGGVDCTSKKYSQPSGCEKTHTGVDHVLGVLALGLQFDAAAGLDVVPEEWAALCAEIQVRPGGLGDVLECLYYSKERPAPTTVQWRPSVARSHRRVECYRSSTRLNYRCSKARSQGAFERVSYPSTAISAGRSGSSCTLEASPKAAIDVCVLPPRQSVPHGLTSSTDGRPRTASAGRMRAGGVCTPELP